MNRLSRALRELADALGSAEREEPRSEQSWFCQHLLLCLRGASKRPVQVLVPRPRQFSPSRRLKRNLGRRARQDLTWPTTVIIIATWSWFIRVVLWALGDLVPAHGAESKRPFQTSVSPARLRRVKDFEEVAMIWAKFPGLKPMPQPALWVQKGIQLQEIWQWMQSAGVDECGCPRPQPQPWWGLRGSRNSRPSWVNRLTGGESLTAAEALPLSPAAWEVKLQLHAWMAFSARYEKPHLTAMLITVLVRLVFRASVALFNRVMTEVGRELQGLLPAPVLLHPPRPGTFSPASSSWWISLFFAAWGGVGVWGDLCYACFDVAPAKSGFSHYKKQTDVCQPENEWDKWMKVDSCVNVNTCDPNFVTKWNRPPPRHQPSFFRWEFEEIYVLRVLMWHLRSQAFPTTRNKPICASQKGWAHLSRAPVWMRQMNIFYNLCLFSDVKPVVVFLTEWEHNQHQPSLSAATFLRLEHLSSGWKSPWPPWIPPIFVGVCKIPVIDLTGLTMVFHPNIHGLINPINFPTNPWVKNLRQQIPNPSVIEPGLSWAALKGLPGWSGRTTTKWVCLKIYWLKWSLNAENDDEPMDLEVPYFRETPM